MLSLDDIAWVRNNALTGVLPVNLICFSAKLKAYCLFKMWIPICYLLEGRYLFIQRGNNLFHISRSNFGNTYKNVPRREMIKMYFHHGLWMMLKRLLTMLRSNSFISSKTNGFPCLSDLHILIPPSASLSCMHCCELPLIFLFDCMNRNVFCAWFRDTCMLNVVPLNE